MAMGKYELDSSETRYQPGSNGTVIVNHLGITDVREMDDIEALLLIKLYEKLFVANELDSDHLSFADIAVWHRQWLGNV